MSNPIDIGKELDQIGRELILVMTEYLETTEPGEEGVTIWKKRTKYAWAEGPVEREGFETAREALNNWKKQTKDTSQVIRIEDA